MKGMTKDEQAYLKTVYDLLDRYQNLEQEKLIPLLAIRILCVRNGYGKVVKSCSINGIDHVVLCAKAVLRKIARLWTRMVEANPPPEAIAEQVMDNIDTIRRADFNFNVNARLYKQLTRMQRREDWLTFRSTPKTEGETTQ